MASQLARGTLKTIMTLPRLHHVQVLCPKGGEPEARRFYGSMLGLREISRPESLDPGGVWFELGDGAELHVGVMRGDDQPSRSRAHFALDVESVHALVDRLRAANVPLLDAPRIPGLQRIYAIDPFGNRIELLQRIKDDRDSGNQAP